MNEIALRLCQYHQWANDKLLHHLDTLPGEVFNATVDGPFSSVADTLEHMATVDDLWLRRLQADTVGRIALPEWHTVQDAFPAFHDTASKLTGLVAQEENLGRSVQYTNSKGELFQNTVLEIVQHLVNHGTYHRGNITVMLRQLGNAGVSTDYIFFVRE